MEVTDPLSAYFSDLSEHDLLSPDEERALSEGIELAEVTAWEKIMERTDVAKQVLTMIGPHLEEPLKLPKLQKLLAERSKPTAKRQAAAIQEAALILRALDLDRIHADAVERELISARAKAVAGEQTWWVRGAGKPAGEYLNEVCALHKDSRRLRGQFVEANLRLVVQMARRYDRGGTALADLIQEGNLGLMHAVSRFDYRKGWRFSTYACWWIRHAIGRALADKARAVRIPVHMLEAQQQLDKIRQELQGDLGRPPTPAELAEAASVPLAKLDQMHRYIMGQPVSLDRPVHDDDDRTVGDTMADPDSEEYSAEEAMTTAALTGQVKRLLHHLSPIEADVLMKRFGIDCDEELTFREIGDLHDLSRKRIRQIETKALDKLKRALIREHRGAIDLD